MPGKTAATTCDFSGLYHGAYMAEEAGELPKFAAGAGAPDRQGYPQSHKRCKIRPSQKVLFKDFFFIYKS